MVRKRDGVTTDLDVFELEIGGEQFVVMSLPASAASAATLDRLSPAEADVARDAAAGLSNEAIAKRRGRAVRTIANQLASVYRKLGVGSRAELATLVVEGVDGQA